MSAAPEWGQAGTVTLAAVAAFGLFALLPTGSRLAPLDFLGDEHAVLQFCDPVNPRPLPALAGRPPVSLAVVSAGPGEAVFRLTTISGKPIGPEDLLPRGKLQMRVAVADARGAPVAVTGVEAGKHGEGEWKVYFGPGKCESIKANFVPSATGKEIEAGGAASPRTLFGP